MFALDTETTGNDFNHGALPFFVSITHCDNKVEWWEWPVDPYTRRVDISRSDLREIQSRIDVIAAWGKEHFDEEIRDRHIICGHNIRFDVKALDYAFQSCGMVLNWPWKQTRCTLIAGHLLASNQPHNLTDMVNHYLGRDIQDVEDELEKIVTKCRKMVKSEHLEGWMIAKRDLACMPSAANPKMKLWKIDGWLPKAISRIYPDQCSDYDTCLQRYCNIDSGSTLILWSYVEKELKQRKLWKIFKHRMKLLPVCYDMEVRGLTTFSDEVEKKATVFTDEISKEKENCVSIAKSLEYKLILPKGSKNKSITKFCYDHLALPKFYNHKSKTGEPAFGQGELERYLTLTESDPAKAVAHNFLESLANKQKLSTALSYLNSYKRFWKWDAERQCYILYPNINPTGTDTLRFSSSNPNGQNISKQKRANLRSCFGPAKGRVWYSIDAKNLELRIPAFEADEKELVDVFLHPNDPPYYGSYHLVVFDTLYPELFAQYGADSKEEFASTFYQWVKNGNFAVIYGCQEQKADETYHYIGAYRLVQDRFPKIAQLASKQIALANKYGYVETIPDRSVDAKRGYPLLCTRTEWGKVMPTIPLNYHISGTAMQWMGSAMIKCHNRLKGWNEEGFDGYMPLQVHDELLFDFPIDPLNDYRIKMLAEDMESCGDDISVPTPVNIKRHTVSWAVGEGVK